MIKSIFELCDKITSYTAAQQCLEKHNECLCMHTKRKTVYQITAQRWSKVQNVSYLLRLMHLTKSQITSEIKSIKHKKEVLNGRSVYEMDGRGRTSSKHRKTKWFDMKLRAIGIKTSNWACRLICGYNNVYLLSRVRVIEQIITWSIALYKLCIRSVSVDTVMI